MASSRTFPCPHCHQPIEWPDPISPGVMNCPACGEGLVIDPEPGQESLQSPVDDELDGLRIKQLSRARRAAIRSRSYAMIAAVICGVAVLQLGFLTWKDIARRGGIVRPTAYLVLACGAVYGLSHFAARARQIRRELEASTLETPATAPDFTSLQDGSQRVNQLNQMR